MLLEDIFLRNIKAVVPQPDVARFLVAVSGGVDSMCLLYLFKKFNFDIEVAHINYHLRGQDSIDDEQLVAKFCSENQIPFHLYTVTERDQKPDGSIQVWARTLRYRFFRETMAARQLDYLCTAHHLNDQLETFLINLSRGSGIKGLAGIPNDGHHIIRPLLDFCKSEIYEYATQHQIPYREDISNQKNDYLRNFIRNEITPQLLQTNTQFLQNFNKSLHLLGEAQDFIQSQVAVLLEQLTLKQTETVRILNRAAFTETSEFLQYQILSAWGFRDRKEYAKFFNAETGKRFISDSHIIIVNRNELLITSKNALSAENDEIILEITAAQHIRLSDYITLPEPINLDWFFDVQALSLPLKLRRKREGDFFYPKGMKGKKKLSKFFKDEKLSILAKSKIWLLCDAEDRILGVIPFRQDGRWAYESNDKQNIRIFYK